MHSQVYMQSCGEFRLPCVVVTDSPVSLSDSPGSLRVLYQISLCFCQFFNWLPCVVVNFVTDSSVSFVSFVTDSHEFCQFCHWLPWVIVSLPMTPLCCCHWLPCVVVTDSPVSLSVLSFTSLCCQFCHLLPLCRCQFCLWLPCVIVSFVTDSPVSLSLTSLCLGQFYLWLPYVTSVTDFPMSLSVFSLTPLCRCQFYHWLPCSIVSFVTYSLV